MGDKIASGAKPAQQAGEHHSSGWNEAIDSAEHAVEIARNIGYPVMIKASAGKGLRVAFNEGGARRASPPAATRRATASLVYSAAE